MAFKIEPTPASTAVFVDFPVDMKAAETAANAALPDKLGRISVLQPGAACAIRIKDVECVSGRIDGEVVRGGTVTSAVRDGKLHLVVPVAYALTSRGIGWASRVEETKKAAFTVTVPIEPVLQPGYTLSVAVPETWQWSERTASFGKSEVDLSKIILPHLSAMQAAFGQAFAADLATQPVATVVTNAWRALQQPVLLARAPELWMLADVQRISGIGFFEEEGRLTFRVALGVRASIHETKPAAPSTPRPAAASRRPPEPSRPTPEMMATHLRLPALVGDERLQASVRRAFPTGEQMVTRADRYSEEVTVATRRAQVYTSQRQLALQIDLDILAPDPVAGRKGRLHLVGRPALESSLDTVAIESISMPPTVSRETRVGSPRVGFEPFGSTASQRLKIDISPDIRDALAQVNATLERQLDEHIQISGRFDAARVVAVEPVAEGLALFVLVAGKLILKPDLAHFRAIETAAGELKQTLDTPASGAPSARAVANPPRLH